MQKNILLILFLTISINIVFFTKKSSFLNVLADNRKTIFLTFDDGPTKNTNKILDILDNQNIKGTFFVVGNKINDEKLLKKIIKNDHYIGLHTMSHDYRKLYKSEDALNIFLEEIVQEQVLIQKITGFRSFLIRAPYSDGYLINDIYINAIINLNFKLWDWNVDSKDWKASTVEEIINNIINDIKLINNKDVIVILFHEHDITIEALPKVISILKEQGYVFKAYDPERHIPVNFKSNSKI